MDPPCIPVRFLLNILSSDMKILNALGNLFPKASCPKNETPGRKYIWEPNFHEHLLKNDNMERYNS